jgi:hypothetical protein
VVNGGYGGDLRYIILEQGKVVVHGVASTMCADFGEKNGDFREFF